MVVSGVGMGVTECDGIIIAFHHSPPYFTSRHFLKLILIKLRQI
jgi:hypothetical protein